MVDYSYLSEKVLNAPGETKPFEHVYIEDFLSGHDFAGCRRACETTWWNRHIESPWFGKMLRLQTPPAVVRYLGGEELTEAIRDRLGIFRDTEAVAEIQRYDTGYEIPPHADVRRKAVTWMININPDGLRGDVHTKLCVLKQSAPVPPYVTDRSIQRGWLEWEDCDVVRTISKNNSLVMFPVSDFSLHAVKLDYDDSVFKRTQIYGTLLYKE